MPEKVPDFPCALETSEVVEAWLSFFEEGALNYFCTSQYLPTFQTTGKACSRGNGKISDLA